MLRPVFTYTSAVYKWGMSNFNLILIRLRNQHTQLLPFCIGRTTFILIASQIEFPIYFTLLTRTLRRPTNMSYMFRDNVKKNDRTL